MAARSRHSGLWVFLVAAAAVVIALALWLLFAGRAATPTTEARLDLDPPRPSLPDAPRLPPVEPPTVPSPGPAPAPTG